MMKRLSDTFSCKTDTWLSKKQLNSRTRTRPEEINSAVPELQNTQDSLTFNVTPDLKQAAILQKP